MFWSESDTSLTLSPRVARRYRTGHRRHRLLDALSVTLFVAATMAQRTAALLRRRAGVAGAAAGNILTAARRSGRPVRSARSVHPAHRAAPSPRAAVELRPCTRGHLLARRLTLNAAAIVAAMGLIGLLTGPTLRLAAKPMAGAVAHRGLPAFEQRSSVLAADGSPLAVLHDGINRRVVPLDQIPQVMLAAVLAAEDKGFRTHGGYDSGAMARALSANVRAREITQGASTITQQLAKANFVGGQQNLLRKGKELLYAVALEQRYSKDELLERYLNQVYFGSRAYGVAAAAEEFFGIEPAALTVEQAALLAGLIRAPGAMDPRTDPAPAKARRDQVLDAMLAQGYLTPGQAVEAQNRPLEVLPARPPAIPEPFVVEAVKREFLANPAFGATEAERRHQLLAGGLEIRTTLDPRLQAAARTALGYVTGDLGTALVAVDPRSGAILALHDGGEAEAGQFDVATQGRRAPGSTFKPLAAAAALEAGMPQTQRMVGDGPIELDYRNAPEPWQVNNYNGSRYGPVVLRDAVVNSVNTAFAQIGVALGPEKIANVAQRLGIDVDRALGPPDDRGPAMALGGLRHGVSPLELATAYGTFAAGGAYAQPYLIAQVTGPDGRDLYRAAPTPQRVLDPGVNATVVDMLQDAVTFGTGAAAALPGWEPLGKTGTSEEAADGWFVGAVPVLSAAVWVGHPGAARPVPGLTGGRVAAPVWREFMASALRGNKPVAFPSTAATSANPARPLDLPVARPCSSKCTPSAALG